MANSSINLIELDFQGIKSSLKSHLSSQSKFQDYDFDGSNMNVLLDVLSYNTYLNSFYLNMVASEMFLDSAQLRDSIVSHAKELNYLPRSFRSAQANVNISITPSTSVSSVLIPSKTSFTSRIGSNTFNFVTRDAIALTASNNNIFSATNITLYEGSYVTESFIKNDSITNQRFLLNNQNIDTTSLEVVVYENSETDVHNFTQAFSLFGLSSNTNSFFIQPAENEQYEIVFGDNISGRTPLNGSLIEISYRVCNGELPNGCDTFVNNSSIDGHSNVSITVNKSAMSGSVSETIESIKFNAPRSLQTQERAVTENDYEILLSREFTEIRAVSAYGGDRENPPQYGKVYIAVDIEDTDGVPDIKKTLYNNFLKDKVPLGITTEIISPDFVFLRVLSNVFFNKNITSQTTEQISTKVKNSIIIFNDTYLNDFKSKFRLSNFTSTIDNADLSIINNDTTVNPFVLLSLKTNTSTDFKFNFNTSILETTPTTSSHALIADRGLFSSSFVQNGLNCQLEDDGKGNIRVVKITNTEIVEVSKIGTINYSTGEIIIAKLLVDSFTGPGIKIYIKPTSQDYFSSQRNILKIQPEDLIINVTATEI